MRSVAEGSSMNVGGDRTFVFTPGESLATDMRVPGLPCPQPCGIEALFPDLGPEPPADDFVAEITPLCRGALSMYGDAAVREAIPGLLNDLRSDRRMRRVKDIDAAAEQLSDLVLRGVLKPVR